MSVHAVEIHDAGDIHADVIDVLYFCSDYCAQSHESYAGWNGCHELPYGAEVCAGCGFLLQGVVLDDVLIDSFDGGE